jgi:hypothetical protein
LQNGIGELTIIPFGQSKEPVLEMFAEGAIAKLCEQRIAQRG